jgi:hypothetical protein
MHTKAFLTNHLLLCRLPPYLCLSCSILLSLSLFALYFLSVSFYLKTIFCTTKHNIYSFNFSNQLNNLFNLFFRSSGKMKGFLFIVFIFRCTKKNNHFERLFHQYFEGVYLTYSNNVSVFDMKHWKRLKNFNQFFLYENFFFLEAYLIENRFKVGKIFDKIA